jgi:adenylate cyclase
MAAVTNVTIRSERGRPSPAAIARRARLVSGLVLFTYVSTHLLNHALGLISLGALEAGRHVFLAVWRSPPGTILLYGAFVTHLGLALWSIYRRRSLRMSWWEGAQLLLGLAVPLLLIEHIVGTRLAHTLGFDDSYAYVILVLWVLSPEAGLRQVATVMIAWLHGCIGLHFWLRLKPWYGRGVALFYASALLVPVLALLGFVAAGRAVADLAADPTWLAAMRARMPDAAAIETMTVIYRAGWAGFVAAVGGTLVARAVRQRIARRKSVTVSYPDGRQVEVPRGTTLLEASRIGGIPHASVCGGRGRCSTCRVRVIRGGDRLPPASADEMKVLARVGASPGTRLACQTRPSGPVEIMPLLPPHAGPGDARGRPSYLQGAEEEIAILFCDLRAFTNLAEHRLPYDLVFLLNRYFRAMGQAVEQAGGRIDKFIGDGVMALFGIGDEPTRGCRQALAAARRMSESLAEMNASLAHDLPTPLRIGIGIHAGPAIVGEMGYGAAVTVTAVGDSVNTASRLESLTKEFGCQLVMSESVTQRAGLDVAAFERREIEIRGKLEPIPVRIVKDARDLPAD